MAGYPDPRDPRIQEEIHEAVQRARDSALGSFMTEQDIANSAAGYLGPTMSAAPGIPAEIEAEVRRQAAGGRDWRRRFDADPVRPTPSQEVETDTVPSVEPRAYEPASAASMSYWMTDNQIGGLESVAHSDRETMMRDRWDPTCPSEFYRGYITMLDRILTALPRTCSLRQYLGCVDRADELVREWPGTEQRHAGARFAAMNAAQYATSGAAVDEITATMFYELSCIATCFRRACELGH
ncbi:hypothetical protein ACFXHA_38710 [Nocardia sp. NPDC059240]|uniref:hypothetical protein n=1 Tax=Nocardia sp. NPDC059240 TaxID=3346786 RepID=UPI0036D07E7C